MADPAEYRAWRDPTKLIATAIYTRGLWSALFLWRALSVRPFKARAVEWGVSDAELRTHLHRALTVLLSFTAVEYLLFWLSQLYLPNVAGFLFLFLVALQWVVLPWIASK